MRVISCWSLSRYSFWLLAGAQEAAVTGGAGPSAQSGGAAAAANGPAAGAGAGTAGPLAPVIEGLVRSVRDPNRYVQEAACSALATICETIAGEDAVDMITAYVRPMAEALGWAISSYGRRNLRLACDATCMLAEAAPALLSEPPTLALLVPPLGSRLSALGPHERELLPVFECLTGLAVAAGRHVDAYAPALFEAALRCATTQLQLRADPVSGGGEQGGGLRCG